MDALVKSILSMLRVKSGEFAFVDLLGNSGIRIAPSNRTILHLVLRGSAVLRSRKTGATVNMNANDFAFCLHDTSHELIAVVPSGTRSEPQISDMTRYFGAEHSKDIPPHVQFGRGNRVAHIFSGALLLDSALNRSILRVLPELLFVQGQKRGLSGKIDYIYSSRQFFKASSTPGANFFLRCLAELLLGEAIRHSSNDIKVSLESVSNSRSLTQVMIALQMMTNQPEKKWTVTSLATGVNMSRSGFAVAFRDAVGQPPLEHLTQIRMNRSVELLKSDAVSLKDIAYLVGYESDIAFTRVFRRTFGETPGKYRKRIRVPDRLPGTEALVRLDA